MPADRITFDSSYMREYAKNNVERALTLLNEAQASLKRANRHSGWLCGERERVNSELAGISSRLERAITACGNLSSALNKGASRFEALENSSASAENSIWNKLRENWLVKAAAWVAGVGGGALKDIGGAIKNLFVQPVPPSPRPQRVTIAAPAENETAIMPPGGA
jgi:hypothetical protein